MKQPDPLMHQRVSFVKSFVRCVGFGVLAFGHVAFGATLLIVAELISVVEELV